MIVCALGEDEQKTDNPSHDFALEYIKPGRYTRVAIKFILNLLVWRRVNT
jgi:hypothetical protein